jgi:hypothetical protein
MKPILSTILLSAAAFGAWQSTAAEGSKGVPHIQFETNFYDLGSVTAMESVSGSFKFKNIGDAVLKIDPPMASCDCTEPKIVPDRVQPGQTGEVFYTIKLERPLTGRRTIRVPSNDPDNPSVQLDIAIEYTHLFELAPKALRISLPPGQDEIKGMAMVSRSDGKPLKIESLKSSADWITAEFDPPLKREDSSGRIMVTVHRPKTPPGPFEGKVQLWMTLDEKSRSAQSLKVSGDILGEIAATPASMYWVLPDFGTNKAAYPAESLSKTIHLVSVLGKEVQINKVSTDIKNLTVKLLPMTGQDAGKKFDLLLKFDELPEGFTNGRVVVETPLPALPRLEVPLTIAVPN